MSQLNSLLESANTYKSLQSDSARLSAKWAKTGLLEGMGSEQDKNNMSMILENQAKQLVTENTQTGGPLPGSGTFTPGTGAAGQWAGVALPLVRRVFGEIAAKEFVSVQPMNLPSGLVFYLDFKYGSNRAPFTAGGSLYGANGTTNVTDIDSASLYGAGKFGYSINSQSLATAATTGSTSWATFNLDAAYSSSFSTFKTLTVTLPASSDANAVRSFIFTGTSASIVASDILQQFTSTNGTTVTFVVTGSKVANAGAVQSGSLQYSIQPTPAARGDYEDSPANSIAIPEINVQLKSEAIVAKTRKLKAQWTPEFAQDLNAYHSVDAEAELTGVLSQYISMEIDLEILDMLIQNAFTVDYWSAVNNQAVGASGVVTENLAFYNTQGGWFQTLGTKLQKVSNKIHQLTLRGGANFLVTSPTVATILESIPGFASDGDGEKMEFNFGVQKVGTLNSRYKVYKNPYMTENVILMGYKGAQFLEAGAVFAPYVPLIMTPLLYDPNTFTPRKGLMTRYAKKMIRPDYYGKIYVAGLNTI